MSLSTRHLDSRPDPVPVDWHGLSKLLEQDFPEISVALVTGSAREGLIPPHGDLDLAILLGQPMSPARLIELGVRVSHLQGGTRCDLAILSPREPILGFEALQGRLVLQRDPEAYASFFSHTCRAYEESILALERQLRYRLANPGLS